MLDIKFLSLLVTRAGWRRVKLAPVPRVVNGGSLVDEICYIEITILILSLVLSRGIMGTSTVMLVYKTLYYQ